MSGLSASFDTARYEVTPELGVDGRLTPDCAARVNRLIDDNGFVVLPGLLSEAEMAATKDLVSATLADPHRETATFASETDIAFGRRDFCPLPSTSSLLDFGSLVLGRMAHVIGTQCEPEMPVLEVAAMASYRGSSHQYVHRDPAGVLGVFVALADTASDQGGTLVVPGTHRIDGYREALDGLAPLHMHLFQLRSNIRVMRRNLWNLTRLALRPQPQIGFGELRRRVMSTAPDLHQPNAVGFLTGRNPFLSVKKFGPRTIKGLLLHGRRAVHAYQAVQVAPRAGSVFLYRSDVLHAGTDNRNVRPRNFVLLSLAHQRRDPKQWQHGYSPHSTLRAEPLTVGDLLNRHTERASPS